MEKSPNIVLIVSDQHNAKVVGHEGHPDVKTPNMDRLAEEGVRFRNAITQNPICTPSRVSFLSGQYCHNHGYYGLSGPNPGGLPNIFGHFRRFGYATSAIGKIHCPEYWVEDDTDVFHETCTCSIGGRSKAYEQFLEERGKLHLEDHEGLPEFGKLGVQKMEGRPSPLQFDEAQEGWITAQAIRFMERSLEEGKPFLVHLSHPRPHQCTSPSEPFWSMYEEGKLSLPPNADSDLEGKAPHFRRSAENWRRGNWTLFEPKTFEAGRLRKLHGYLGAVSQVDHAIGLILKWLDENKLAEDTIVVYTSDHGEYACEHGIMEKAPGICSDAVTRVPLLWKWTGHIAEGLKVDQIVELIDISTTLCALTGIDLLETSDGKDLSRLLRGEPDEPHRVGVTEFAWSKSLRKGRYRFVYYPPDMFPEEYPEGFGELYDLEEDPWEMRNLFFEPNYRGTVEEMRNELFDWLVTTTRPKTVLGLGYFDGYQATTRYHCSMNDDGKVSPDRIRQMKHRNYL